MARHGLAIAVCVTAPVGLDHSNTQTNAYCILNLGGVAAPSRNSTRRAAARGSYWVGSIARKATGPRGSGPSYAVFRNALDYGAAGNGVTDDAAAIKRAMNDGRR
ncbi:hypothetical protein LX36DRAFT_715367 [Colletotrichum falcatum]|nr:hypothetical protein LX36DRAFT_715367 [Colletotrichum falcatum]